MDYGLLIGLVMSGLAVGIPVLLLVGRRVGERRLAEDPEGSNTGGAAIEGAVFALLGLLIAFTFSGAAARFDSRRMQIVQESNDIGTAWLRLDLLPPAAATPLRDLARRYLDARLELFGRAGDRPAMQAIVARTDELQAEIWRQAVAACQAEARDSKMLVLPALNAMFDTANQRNHSALLHPPLIIFVMLGVLTLVGTLFAGYATAGAKRLSLLHAIGFTAVLALTVFIIIDLELPRLGFIRIDAFDRVLIQLRESMK